VPEADYNFYTGGYQVCEKCLKDRIGSTLTKDDFGVTGLQEPRLLTPCNFHPSTSPEISPMFAEIHARDFGKKDSEGQTLSMQGVRINTQIRALAGLPFGEPRERFTLIIQGEVQEGTILRTLRLEVDCHEIETIVQAAALGGMMPATGREKVLKLLSELQTAVATLSANGFAPRSRGTPIRNRTPSRLLRRCDFWLAFTHAQVQ